MNKVPFLGFASVCKQLAVVEFSVARLNWTAHTAWNWISTLPTR